MYRYLMISVFFSLDDDIQQNLGDDYEIQYILFT